MGKPMVNVEEFIGGLERAQGERGLTSVELENLRFVGDRILNWQSRLVEILTLEVRAEGANREAIAETFKAEGRAH